MQVYFLRHGAAANPEPGGTDRDRCLTPEGAGQVRRTVHAAAAAGVRPTLLLTSPYPRAMQSARIAAEEMQYEGMVVESEALTPDSNPYAVWDEIREHVGESAILLTGHEPLMGETAAYLLGSNRPLIHMVTAALVRVDVDRFGGNPCGMLQWMLTPALIAE